MTRKFAIPALCLLLCLVCTINAQAKEKTLWSVIGGALIPNPETAKKELIVLNAEGANFANDKTGDAVLFYPVVNAHQTIKKASWIKLVFNRTLAGGTVFVYLHRVEMKTGKSNRVGPGASVPADAKGLKTFKGPISFSETGEHEFEEGYFYYVRITFNKHNLLNRMSVKGVSIGID